MDEKPNKCFWCDNSIPRIINKYMPCENCKSLIIKGILFIEVQDIPMQMEQPPLLMESNYPTGYWYLFKPTIIPKIFDDETTEKILRDRIVFLDRTMFENLGIQRSEFKESVIH